MSRSSLFRVNSKDVVSDLVEDEVIIVDLKSGSYYSLDGVGAHVWVCLERGMDLANTIQSAATTYDGSESEIADAVERLVTELQNERLIIPGASENGQGAATPLSPPTDSAPQSQKKNFIPPILHKYTDMQELLLVDPIHDVDDQGWPILKKENPQ